MRGTTVDNGSTSTVYFFRDSFFGMFFGIGIIFVLVCGKVV